MPALLPWLNNNNPQPQQQPWHAPMALPKQQPQVIPNKAAQQVQKFQSAAPAKPNPQNPDPVGQYVQQKFVQPMLMRPLSNLASYGNAARDLGALGAAALTHNNVAQQNAAQALQNELRQTGHQVVNSFPTFQGYGTSKAEQLRWNREQFPKMMNMVMGMEDPAIGAADTPHPIDSPLSPKDAPTTAKPAPATPKPRQTVRPSQTPELGLKPIPATRENLGLSSSAKSSTAAPKARGLTGGIKGSPEFSQQLKKAVNSSYDPFTNKAATQTTQEFMKQPLDQAKAQVLQTLSDFGKGGQRGQAFTGAFGKQEVANAGAVMKALDAKGDVAGAQAIHDLLATKLTNAGQTAQAASLIYNRTPEGLKYMAQRDLTKAGVKITPELQSQMDTALQKVKAAPEGSRQQMLARAQFSQLVGKQIPSGIWDKALSLYKTGLLSSPVTAAKVAVVNPVTTALETIKDFPAAATDKVASLFTGERTKVAPNPTNLAAGVKQLPTALQDAKLRLVDNITMPGSSSMGTHELSSNTFAHPDGPNFGVKANGQRSLLDRATGGVSSKILNGYTSAVPRVHGAMQTLPYEFRGAMSRMQSAQAEAINAVKRGDIAPSQTNSFIQDYLANAPKQAADQAKLDSEYATSQQKTALGQAASGLQQNLGPVGQVVAPITRIPGAVATQVVNYSPAGFLKAAGKAAADKAQGLPFDQRAFSDNMGRAITGTGIMAGGAALGLQGRVTGAYPSDQGTQSLWQSANVPANGLYVGGHAYPNEPWKNTGGKWVQVGSALGPAGQAALTAGSTVADGAKNGLVGLAQKGISEAARVTTDQPYLTGISGAMNLINNPSQSKSFYDQTAGSIVPNWLRSIATATDPLQRQTSVADPVQSMKNAITNGVPGLREQNLPQVDTFGNQIPRNDSTLGTLLNPFKPQSGNPTALTNALGTLHNTQDINGKPLTIPTQIPKNYQVTMANGQKQPLTDQQRLAFIQQSGQAARGQLNQLIQTPNFQQATPAQQSKMVNDVVSGQRDLAKAQLPGAKSTLTTVGKAAAANVLPTAKGTTKVASLGTPQAKYQAALAKYQQDKAAGTLTPVQDYKMQATLAKESVTSNYSTDVNNLYGMSKAQISAYLKANPTTANQTYSQLQQLDQQLYSKGLVSKPKFANGLSTAKGSGRTSRVGGIKAKRLSVPKVRGVARAPKLKSFRVKAIRSKAPSVRLARAKVPSMKLRTPKVTKRLA